MSTSLSAHPAPCCAVLYGTVRYRVVRAAHCHHHNRRHHHHHHHLCHYQYRFQCDRISKMDISRYIPDIFSLSFVTLIILREPSHSLPVSPSHSLYVSLTLSVSPPLSLSLSISLVYTTNVLYPPVCAPRLAMDYTLPCAHTYTHTCT
jgi:hypothetical protein